MPYLPGPSRLVAHVILDTVSSIDHTGDEITNEIAMLTALEGLGDTGAVIVSGDETGMGTGGELHVDVSELFIPVILLVDRLAEKLAAARGEDEISVIHELREYIDHLPSAG